MGLFQRIVAHTQCPYLLCCIMVLIVSILLYSHTKVDHLDDKEYNLVSASNDSYLYSATTNDPTFDPTTSNLIAHIQTSEPTTSPTKSPNTSFNITTTIGDNHTIDIGYAGEAAFASVFISVCCVAFLMYHYCGWKERRAKKAAKQLAYLNDTSNADVSSIEMRSTQKQTDYIPIMNVLTRKELTEILVTVKLYSYTLSLLHTLDLNVNVASHSYI